MSKKSYLKTIKFTVCSVLALSFLVTSACFATLFYSRKAALEFAFPAASSVDMKNVILSAEEKNMIQRASASPLESRIFTYYVAKKGEDVLGYAFIESHVVRTMPEAVMTVIDSEGNIEKVFILAFYEPLEYIPSDLWLKQFLEKTFNSNLRLNSDIQSVTGATLSCRAITKGVKKNLVFYKLKIANKG